MHFAGEIHRGGRVLTDSPSAAVLADILVIADEDHRADPGVPGPRQAGDLLPRRRAAARSLPRVLQPDDRQDGIVAEEAESRIGQAVAEVRIVLPRAGLVHERDRDRQCLYCPGLSRHPGRVISSHPRSITPAEPVRLGTPGAKVMLSGARLESLDEVTLTILDDQDHWAAGLPDGVTQDEAEVFVWVRTSSTSVPSPPL